MSLEDFDYTNIAMRKIFMKTAKTISFQGMSVSVLLFFFLWSRYSQTSPYAHLKCNANTPVHIYSSGIPKCVGPPSIYNIKEKNNSLR